jgi:hypothetical protein
VRGIFPTVKLVTRTGIQDVPEARVATVCEAIVQSRKTTG